MAEEQPTAGQEYNAEIVRFALRMGIDEPDKRCRIVRRNIHRLFEPEFLPCFLQVLNVMSKADTTSGEAQEENRRHIVSRNVLAAVAFELQNFLAEFQSKSLSPMAVCLDLLLGPLSASISFPDSNPDVEFVKCAIRYRERILSCHEQIHARLRRMAAISEARSLYQRL